MFRHDAKMSGVCFICNHRAPQASQCHIHIVQVTS